MHDSRGSKVAKLKAVIPQKWAEESVRFHAESPLVERHKGHHISFCSCGECNILRHIASLEFRGRHKPMLHEFLQVEGVQSYSSTTWGEREGNTFEILIFLPISFCSLLFPSLFVFSMCREGRRERTTDGAQGRPPAMNPTEAVVKWQGPLRLSKGPNKLSLPASPTPRTSH
jgi:hypothetical protein